MLLAADAPEHAPQLYHIVEQLEKIADRYKYICRIHENASSNPDPSVLTIIEKTNMFLHQFEILFYDFSLGKITEFGKERKRIPEQMDKINRQKQNKFDSSTLVHLAAINAIIFDLNGPLLTMKLPSS